MSCTGDGLFSYSLGDPVNRMQHLLKRTLSQHDRKSKVNFTMYYDTFLRICLKEPCPHPLDFSLPYLLYNAQLTRRHIRERR